MAVNTKILADSVVEKLSAELKKYNLSYFKSIYVCGSYCRGDWLNSNSDLDIHTICDDNQSDLREENFGLLKSLVDEALRGRDFPAHSESIEYGFSSLENIPKTYEEALKPSPYAYFSTLMFDLKENHITLYGEEINGLLPQAPNPRENAEDWLLSLINRTENLKRGDFRLYWITYKIILAAQILFGEITINKYKILELYQKHIPEFPAKYFGEIVIRNYLGSVYPERPPVIFDEDEYKNFISELSKLIKT
ncbi:MAG: hypothetical protein FWD71_12975 [Oscillospiraceae bacterium]|nr:hypothetical protein [Oscillospiraceae bacterium]